jgi:hypothetical protein
MSPLPFPPRKVREMDLHRHAARSPCSPHKPLQVQAFTISGWALMPRRNDGFPGE